MTSVKCPYCGVVQTSKPINSWKYGKNINVDRYRCKCKKLFNQYISPKKTWTIPKSSKKEVDHKPEKWFKD